jgi:glycosyltransferase involved in cell wall biosynthesis
MSKKTISICIPAFNEAQNIFSAVERVEAVFESELKDYQLEIVITDNASTDDTWKEVNRLAEERDYLKGFRLSRNFGYQNSVFTALSLAAGDAVVELDADLEDPPEVIPEFVRAWEQDGYEVVYGVRAKRHAPMVLKFLIGSFYRILNRLSDVPIPENAGDFRLLDRKVVDILKDLPETGLYVRGLVGFLGFSQKAVIYEREPRQTGASKFSLLRYLGLALDAITAFSKTPLRLISLLGLAIFLAAVILSGWFLWLYLSQGVPVQGFTTIVLLLLSLHGLTFIVLGVLGEYLGRVFDHSKNRPRAIISEAVNAADFPRVI